MPPEDFVQSASRRRLFFDSKGNPRNVTNSKGKKRRPSSKEMSEVLKTNDALFLDFVQRCLTWDPTKRMTPDEGLQHQWILEGNFNKIRPRTRPTVKRATDASAHSENSNDSSYKKQNSNKATKPAPTANDKLKQERSGAGSKMAPAERLRPIGASAEEEVCEHNVSNKQQDGERPVHIIIRSQEDSGSREDSEEPAQCFPPIM